MRLGLTDEIGLLLLLVVSVGPETRKPVGPCMPYAEKWVVVQFEN
jgi:hypothetical protein